MWSRIIKYYSILTGKWLIGILAVGMIVVTALLCVEYRFFRQQAEKMLALKEDYQAHLLAVNRVLHEHNKTKERLEQLEGMLEGQKKKFVKINEADLVNSSFPRGVRVFSSDDEKSDEKADFVPINRELEYLKKSSLGYLKKHKLDVALQRIKHDEAWTDYTDVLLERHRQRCEPPKKRIKRRQNRRRAIVRRHTETISDTIRDGMQRDLAQHDIHFTWPIKRSDFWLSSFFGPRRGPNGLGFHYGIDMAAVRGTPIHPAAPGIVVEARNAPGFGKTVVIAHNRKYRTRYAHLDKILVKAGQKVTCSTTIGRVGSTGHVRSKKGRDPSHLHFEVAAYGKKVNPMYFFS